MKHIFRKISLSKQDGWLLLALILAIFVVAAVSPVVAQGPQGDVNAAAAVRSHQYATQKFSLRPYSIWSVNSSTVPVPQYIPENSQATTELMVNRAGDVSSVSVAFDYNIGVVSVNDVRPGTIFDGLTEGVDYIVQKNLNRASPINPTQEVTLPNGWPVNYIQAMTTPVTSTVVLPTSPATRRSYINISIINPNKKILYQNGSLINISWNVASSNPGAGTFLVFTQIDLKDVSGNSIAPCFGIEPTTDYLPPFGNECVNLRQAQDTSSNFTVLTDTLVFDVEPAGAPDGVYEDEPIVGFLQVTNRPLGLTFQVALQGLTGSSAKYTTVDVTAKQFGFQAVSNPDLDGRVLIALQPPYDSLTIEREGYLDAYGEGINTYNLFQVQLLAGDVNEDNTINIFDLTIMANSLNSSTGGNTVLERMDYNDDGVINIADLALVAGNFRTFGPIPIP